MSDQNPYSPPPGGSSPAPEPSPYGSPPGGPPPAPEPSPYGAPPGGPPPAAQPPAGPPAPDQPYPGYEQPYQDPGYAQPAYAQPGQPPAYQPYPEYAAQPQGYAGGDDRPTSTLAVVGFIVSLVGLILPVALIGFILSLVALPQTGRDKKKGRGFAIAGAIIGGLLTLLTIVGIILVIAFFSQLDADGDGEISQEEFEDFFGVEEGSTSDQDFEDLFENEAAGPSTVLDDPAAVVVSL